MIGFAIIVLIVVSVIGLIRNIDRMSDNRENRDDIFRSFGGRDNDVVDYDKEKRDQKTSMLLELRDWENNESNITINNALKKEGYNLHYEIDRDFESRWNGNTQPRHSTTTLPDWIKEEREKMGMERDTHLTKREHHKKTQVKPAGITDVPDWVKEGRKKKGNMTQKDEPTIFWKTYSVDGAISPVRVEKVSPIKEKISHIEEQKRQVIADLDTVKDAVSKMSSDLDGDTKATIDHKVYNIDNPKTDTSAQDFGDGNREKATNKSSAIDDFAVEQTDTPKEHEVTPRPPEKTHKRETDSTNETKSVASEKAEKPEVATTSYQKTGKYDNLGSEEKLLAWVDDFSQEGSFIKFGFFDNKYYIPPQFLAEFGEDEKKIIDLVTQLKRNGLLTSVDDGEIFAYPFQKRIVLTSIGRERLGNYK